MRKVVLSLGLVACAPASPDVDVDHSAFWGTWSTPEGGVPTSFATYDVDLTVSGTQASGSDTRFLWKATVQHGASSPTPSCLGEVWYAGRWRAACEQDLVLDPTAGSSGSQVQGGCVRLTIEDAVLSRSCPDPDDDLPLGPVPAVEEAFDALDYAFLQGGGLWLDWEPVLVLHACDASQGGCGPGTFPDTSDGS